MADRLFASIPAGLFRFARSIGVPEQELLCASGLTPEILDDVDGWVDYEALVGLCRVLLARFPDQPIGLRYAQVFSLEALGAVGYLLASSVDARQCLNQYMRFAKLTDPKLVIGDEAVGALHRIWFDHEPRIRAMREPIELSVLSTVRIAQALMGTDEKPVEICFRHAQRHPIELYTAAFSAPVRFSAAYDGFMFPAEMLDRPMPRADPTLGRYLSRYLTALQESVTTADPPVEVRVREEVQRRLPAGDLAPRSIARALRTSARSLQRSLQARSTSLSAQIDEVRRAQAAALLARPELSVAEVAFMLGYTDPRAFYRCVRRWFGTTPKGLRPRGPSA